ncbi:hypothetical protein ACLK19_00440 [Escherichia coli]
MTDFVAKERHQVCNSPHATLTRLIWPTRCDFAGRISKSASGIKVFPPTPPLGRGPG